MATLEPLQPQTIWQKLQVIDRRWLYLILIVVVAICIIFPKTLPATPLPQSKKLYESIANAPDGSLVIISSSWTMSSRGESLPLYKALVRLCMRKHHKIIVVSLTEPAAAAFALSLLGEVNNEPGHPRYVQGRDWVSFGYLPNADSVVQGWATNMAGFLQTQQVLGRPASQTEMLKNVKQLSDVLIIVDVTASSSHAVFINYVGGLTKIGLMCTGVMFAEALPYVDTGQLEGVAPGARGAYDFEVMMSQDPQFKAQGPPYYGAGREYMTPLTGAMFLLILAIIVGNVAMAMARKTTESGGA